MGMIYTIFGLCVIRNIRLDWYTYLNFANINRFLIKFKTQIYEIKWYPMVWTWNKNLCMYLKGQNFIFSQRMKTQISRRWQPRYPLWFKQMFKTEREIHSIGTGKFHRNLFKTFRNYFWITMIYHRYLISLHLWYSQLVTIHVYIVTIW